MQKEQTPLVLPQTPEVTRHVAAGGTSITFLQVALDILVRLERVCTERQKDEIRFVQDCLHAGPAQTQLPCDLVADKHENDTEVRTNFRLTYCETTIGKARSSSSATSIPSHSSKDHSAVPSPRKVTRKDGDLRGSLQACEVSVVENPQHISSMGLPWLGPEVPHWPTAEQSMTDGSKTRMLFDEQFNDWALDMFTVSIATGGRPLLYVGWEAMRRCGCFSEFHFEPKKVGLFLEISETKYMPESQTPYHTNIHAADVTQSLWAILADMGGRIFFDPMDTAVGVLSAIVHDMGHDGRTNAFHTNVQDNLALIYNDKSVLENFHVSSAFMLLLVQSSSNFVAGLPREQRVIFRREMIDMVLGTDMAQHFKMLGEFRELLAKHRQVPEEWHDNDSAMYVLRSMVLHCADISNQAKPMSLAQQWTARVLLECFAQGDAEKELGLPVSPLCDRSTTDIPDSQAGFIQFIVQPSFELLTLLVPRAYLCVEQTVSNFGGWKRLKGYPVDITSNFRKMPQYEAWPQNEVDTISNASEERPSVPKVSKRPMCLSRSFFL
eukprot:TRINITY_DN36884_c0_g1_i1.p1 TRINITY_DN36884_c0_g1~~TRINITY_DN36884_c0_g1_i1.p1  ORF type:complete len:551 (-),score=81.21 TRINITY_DN36884_c0_g1_i1:122-1774(-)